MTAVFSLIQTSLTRRKQWVRPALILLAGLCALSVVNGWALEPQMDQDNFFKPLVDNSRQDNSRLNTSQQGDSGSPIATPLEGHAQKQGQIPVNDSPSESSHLITGKVQTLQQAIDSERDSVDWYGWYLSARAYISQTGGLRCTLGTPIKFYRSGKIEALTLDTACIGSVIGKRFALPPNTKLDALILPVRHGQGPPASKDEIYYRVRTKYN